MEILCGSGTENALREAYMSSFHKIKEGTREKRIAKERESRRKQEEEEHRGMLEAVADDLFEHLSVVKEGEGTAEETKEKRAGRIEQEGNDLDQDEEGDVKEVLDQLSMKFTK